MQFCILSVVWNTLRIPCNWIRKTNLLYTFAQHRYINVYKLLSNKEECTLKMTQRLIGAVSNKRMECPVFRISGKFCRKWWLYRRYDFLSRAWRHKVLIDNACESAVFCQKRSALRKLYRADCCIKRKNRVVQDGKKRICSQAYQKMRNKSGARRAVRYRQYAEYRALFICRKMLMPSCAYWWQGAVYLYIRQGRWGQRFSKNQFGWFAVSLFYHSAFVLTAVWKVKFPLLMPKMMYNSLKPEKNCWNRSFSGRFENTMVSFSITANDNSSVFRKRPQERFLNTHLLLCGGRSLDEKTVFLVCCHACSVRRVCRKRGWAAF